ncbi:2', 3'-cyclic nucleotide 2'-phosphodiesterase [Achromatium sp. WMS2]|nr:2', 3'-cyclic nucleotide 2'-phosphodiesterase [Achromatium sp. WMS2]
MEVYLVGGAVRDRLLGYPVRERDYVVLGATPEQMQQSGYVQVGRDFPIFLHPETREEYALARVERSTSQAHQPLLYDGLNITLKDDLSRRDLTINAMAEDTAGQVIDYFGGQQDLEQRVFRHVSPAFAEDPIRILRVARFMARYGDLGFTIATETLQLMRTMVAHDALSNVAAERIWKELDRALTEKSPHLFFDTLRSCGALAKLMPELDCLWGVPQPSRWHPEIDTGVHTMLVVRMARRLSSSSAVIFAALTHDLGKGETPKAILPSHHGHEERGVRILKAVCQRLGPPKYHCELSRLVARYHGKVHRASELRPRTVLCVLEDTDAFRRPQRLQDMLIACEADYRGRTGFAESRYPQRHLFLTWLQAAKGIDVEAVVAKCARPSLIETAITRARLHAIKSCRSKAVLTL